jgi:tetratricopeptide (TPR) repeat protein
VLIIAAGFCAYHNSLHGSFILDDVFSITENPRIRHLWPISDALSPSAASGVGGRPVVNLSLAVNYALGGMDVWGYHAFNLTIHILAALTLFGLIRRTFLHPKLRERFGSSRMLLATSGASGEWLALAVALLWTVHPLQTEAVTYVSQRCESLMGLFYLLTLYCFVRGVGGGVPKTQSGGASDDRQGRTWFALSVAACFMGMASKEVMVTAPVMVLLYDRTFVSGSFREACHRRWPLYLGLAGSWLLLGWLMVGLHHRSVGYGLGITWWGYALAECRAVVLYLRLALWPRPLIFDYGYYVPKENPAAVVSCALILAALVAAVLVGLKRRPAIGFIGAWFFMILAPTSTVVPILGSPVAEHRMYLPLAAVVMMAVISVFGLGRRLFNERQGIVLGGVAGGVTLVLLTFLTIQRNRDYQSALSIWQDTVEKCPNNFRAHGNLGVALAQDGRVQEAIGHYQQALQIMPEYADGHNDLGAALLQQGKYHEAREHCLQALRLKPDDAQAQYNLAEALVGLSRLPEAIDHYQQALRIEPEYAAAHNNLGIALAQMGRLREAMEHWKQALQIAPDFAEAHFDLGLALEKLRRTPEAIQEYEQALRVKPDFVQARNALARAQAAH